MNDTSIAEHPDELQHRLIAAAPELLDDAKQNDSAFTWLAEQMNSITDNAKHWNVTQIESLAQDLRLDIERNQKRTRSAIAKAEHSIAEHPDELQRRLHAEAASRGAVNLYMSVTPVAGTAWDDLNPAWREIFRILFQAAQATAKLAMGVPTTDPLLPQWQTTVEQGRAYTQGIAMRGEE